MQGSSGEAASLLYSAAFMVRFFDAVALALFARDLRLVLLGDEHGRNTGQRLVWRTGLKAFVPATDALQAAISVSRTRLRYNSS